MSKEVPSKEKLQEVAQLYAAAFQLIASREIQASECRAVDKVLTFLEDMYKKSMEAANVDPEAVNPFIPAEAELAPAAPVEVKPETSEEAAQRHLKAFEDAPIVGRVN